MGEYDNPFIEDPRHNALFTLDRYQGNINALKDRFAEPGYFKLESVQELTSTTGEVNVGLGQCRQYVTRIGELGDGLSGTIKVIWNAIPAIRMAIGGDDDLEKVKDWGKRTIETIYHCVSGLIFVQTIATLMS